MKNVSPASNFCCHADQERACSTFGERRYKMRQMSQKERLDAMLDRPIPKKKVGIVHLEMVKESRRLYGTSRFRTPEEAAEMVMPMFERAHREMVLVMTMDSKLEIQAAEIAAVGGLNYCYIDMKETF